MGLGIGLGRCELAQRPVWPRGIEMVQVDREDPAQMALVDDQDPIEQFSAQGFNHPFADRVRPGCSGRIGQDPDAVRGEDRVERPGKTGSLDLGAATRW